MIFLASIGEAVLEQIILQPAFLAVTGFLLVSNIVGFKVVND